MPRNLALLSLRALNSVKKALNGSRIHLFGVAYKKNVDDPRESPAFTIIEALEEMGAEVSYHDPFVPALPPNRHAVHLTSQPLTPDFLDTQDCVVIVTDHTTVDYQFVVRNSRLVVDTRNATAGFEDPRCQIFKA